MGNPTIDPSKKARGSNQESLRQKKEEKMQKPPQIIVIPQSMLAGQKSLLRLAPQPPPPPLLHGLPISPPIIRLRLPPTLFQPSPCCSSGWQQATCPISVSSKGSPSGHQGGTERG